MESVTTTTIGLNNSVIASSKQLQDALRIAEESVRSSMPSFVELICSLIVDWT